MARARAHGLFGPAHVQVARPIGASVAFLWGFDGPWPWRQAVGGGGPGGVVLYASFGRDPLRRVVFFCGKNEPFPPKPAGLPLLKLIRAFHFPLPTSLHVTNRHCGGGGGFGDDTKKRNHSLHGATRNGPYYRREDGKNRHLAADREYGRALGRLKFANETGSG